MPQRLACTSTIITRSPEAFELVVAGANDLPRVTWRWSRITLTQEGEGGLKLFGMSFRYRGAAKICLLRNQIEVAADARPRQTRRFQREDRPDVTHRHIADQGLEVCT